MMDMLIKPNKRRKNYSLEINNHGQLVVRTPLRSSRSTIHRLVSDHQEWIVRQQNKQRLINDALADWKDPSSVYYRGNKYTLCNNQGATTVFSPDCIYIPSYMSKSSFLTNQAQAYLPERCLDLSETMGLTPSAITIRRLRSCWGTCHSNGTITLNQALIQAPDWVSDYIMIHECAHLIHFNHSTEFWDLVHRHCDSTKSAKTWLKNHQSVLI